MKKLLRVFLIVSVLLTFVVVPASAAKPSNKVPVCHKGKIIWVAASAVPGHAVHGDPVDAQGNPLPCPS